MSIKFLNTKAIIFDMDGVLFLSSDCHERAFEETLANAGIRDFSYASVAGMRTDEAFRKVFRERERSIDDGTLKEFVQKKRRRALAYLAERGMVAEGSREILLHLRKRYRLALASSASPQTIEIFLKKSGYADVFEFFLDGSSVQNAKPAPDIYRYALQKLDIMPEHAVVIEDSISGVLAAVAAHIPVIALARVDDFKRYERAGATVAVSELKMLKTIFDR